MRPRYVLLIGILVVVLSLLVFAYYDRTMAYIVFAFGFVLFIYARWSVRLGGGAK